MLTLPPAPDSRLIAFVLAGLTAVLTLAAIFGSPAAATMFSPSALSQGERFQPQQQRALPPFGARTVLAPAESPKRPSATEAAR